MNEELIKSLAESMASKILDERKRNDELIDSKFSELSSKILELSSTLSEAINRLDKFSSSLNSMSERVSLTSNLLVGITDKQNEIYADLNTVSKELIDTSEKFRSIDLLNEQHIERFGLLSGGIEACSSSVMALGTRIGEVSDGLEATSNSVSEGQARLGAMEINMNFQTEQTDKINKRIDDHYVSISGFETSLLDLGSKVSETSSQIELAVKDIQLQQICFSDLESDVKEQKVQIDVMIDSISEHHNSISSFDVSISQYDAEIKEVTEGINLVIKDVGQHQTRFLDVEGSIKSQNEQIGEIKDLVNSHSKTFHNFVTTDALESVRNSITGGLGDATRELEALNVHYNSLKSEVSSQFYDITVQFAAVNGSLEALDKDLGDAKKANTLYLSELKLDIEAAAEKTVEFSNSVIEVKELVNTNHEELGLFRTEVEPRLKNHSIAMANLKGDINAVAENVTTIGDSLSGVSTRVEFINSRVDLADKDITAVKTELTSEIDLLDEAMKSSFSIIDEKVTILDNSFIQFEVKRLKDINDITEKVVSIVENSPKLKGERGDRGEKGIGIDAPIWVAGVYREGTIVQHDIGRFSRALKDTSAPPNTKDWERIGTMGLAFTGVKKADRTYIEGDMFIDDGSLFLMSGGEVRMITKRGKDGLPGKDVKGEPGKPGVKGDKGASICGVALSNDKLQLITDEGEIFDIDLKEFGDHIAELTQNKFISNGYVIAEIGNP